MKKIILSFMVLCVVLAMPRKSIAQSEEVQQLLLNVEKLAQFKQILADLKRGYQVISTGYNSIKDLTHGNFNLHKNFLDNLLQVSPAVKNYKRVTGIVNYQFALLKEYKNAFSRFKKDNNFSLTELNYFGHVYNNLLKQSLQNLDELATVVTANKLRMSDDERLKIIDELFFNMQDKLAFLNQFNRNATILAIQRAREKNDATTLQTVYGLRK